MAQYNLGYSSSTTQAEAWANLKTALNNYSSKLTLSYDEETYIAKAEFKEMSFYVTFKVYPNSSRLYIDINLYNSEDTQIAHHQNNAYSSNLYLNVLEAQGDSLIFGTTSVEGDNTASAVFVDADTPCMMVTKDTSSYIATIAVDEHSFDIQTASLTPYFSSESALQMVKVYDSVANSFIEDLYYTVVSKRATKNYDLILASVGQRKFYLFLCAQNSSSNRWLAVECTDKF